MAFELLENGKRLKILYSSDAGHLVWVLRLIKLKTAHGIEVGKDAIKHVLVELSRGKSQWPVGCVGVLCLLHTLPHLVTILSLIKVLDAFKIFQSC